jgi:hypothetical protein
VDRRLQEIILIIKTTAINSIQLFFLDSHEVQMSILPPTLTHPSFLWPDFFVQLPSAFQQLSDSTELTHQNVSAADELLHVSPADEPLRETLISITWKYNTVMSSHQFWTEFIRIKAKQSLHTFTWIRMLYS